MLSTYSPISSIFVIIFSILLNILGLIINKSFANVHEKESHKSEIILPISHRLAFMSGHVEVGIELYKLGELKMAAPHLLHPVSETHAEERKGLENRGFKADIFEQVSESLNKNLPASEIDSLLNRASNNLNELADNIGGDRKEIIKFLLKTAVEEYDLSINNNLIANIGEYQDSWGFIKVAMHHAKEISDTKLSKEILINLQKLHVYWINGPLLVENPVKPLIIKNIANTISRKL
ncbi:MAG: hypothetical protein CBC01_07360 [Betaproteobacteria bacterium TMED41]|nr:MAG: hypothetical protein CBC01_07360 [Betaproteobacteria bacterium TMED41]